MKKRLLALFLTLGLVCTVLTACGDGAKIRADKEITAAKQSAAERSPLASPRTWMTVLTLTGW